MRLLERALARSADDASRARLLARLSRELLAAPRRDIPALDLAAGAALLLGGLRPENHAPPVADRIGR